MEGLTYVKKEEPIKIFRPSEKQLEIDRNPMLMSDFSEEETREVMKTGDEPAYMHDVQVIKKLLDADTASDDTGTYREMHRLVSFFVTNYKYLDEKMEVRLLTTMHARALDYYNLHSGFRFTIRGNSRQKIANNLIVAVQQAVLALPENLKIEALSQIASFDKPPVLFKNEKEYKTEVGIKSEAVSNLMRKYAIEEYTKKMKATHPELSDEECLRRASGEKVINKHTGLLILEKKKLEERSEVLFDQAVPEGFRDYKDYLSESRYKLDTDVPRIIPLCLKNYMRSRDGKPVRNEDKEALEYNKKILKIFKEDKPEEIAELLGVLIQEILDFEMPDFNRFLDEDGNIKDEEEVKDFFVKNYRKFFEISEYATCMSNFLQTEFNSANRMDQPVYAAYVNKYDKQLREKFEAKAYVLARFAAATGIAWNLCGFDSINLLNIKNSEQISWMYDSSKAIMANFVSNITKEQRSTIGLSVKQNRTDYISQKAALMQETETGNILENGHYETGINSYMSGMQRRNERMSKFIHPGSDSATAKNISVIEDKNLKKALMLLSTIGGDDAVRDITKAFLTMDDYKMKAILEPLFAQVDTIPAEPDNYVFSRDTLKSIQYKDVTEAVILLNDNDFVKRNFDPQRLKRVVSRAKIINGIVSIQLNQIEFEKEKQDLLADGLEHTLEISKIEEACNDRTFDLLKLIKSGKEALSAEEISTNRGFSNLFLRGEERSSYGEVQLYVSREEAEQTREQIRRIKEQNGGFYSDEPFPIQDENMEGRISPYVKEIMDYFEQEDAFFNVDSNYNEIQSVFDKFNKGKCVIKGKYPVPYMAECRRIVNEGSITERIALAISVQMAKDTCDENARLYDEDIVESKNLIKNTKYYTELRDIEDALIETLAFKSADGASEEDMKELAKYHLSYEFKNFSTMISDIDKNLEAVGKNINTATDEEKAVAYLKSVAKGYNLNKNIIDKALRVAESDYINSLDRGTGYFVLLHNKNFRSQQLYIKKLGFINEETAKGIIRSKHNREEADAIFKDIFKDYSEKMLSNLVSVGLVGDEISINLRDSMMQAVKITDIKNDRQFYNAVSKPLLMAIKISPVNADGQHVDGFDDQISQLKASISEYIASTNAITDVETRRKAVATNLLAKINEYLANQG